MIRIQRILTLISALVIALLILLSHFQINTYAQNTVGTWFPPINLSKSGGVINPTLIVNPKGGFYAIWEDEFAGFVYSYGDGLSWSEPQAVEFPFSPIESSFYKFAIDSRDRIHAIWINEEGELYYSRSNLLYFDDRMGWGYSQILSRSTISFNITIDENSNIHLAFLRGESRRDGIPAGIYYQHFLDGTTDWSKPVALEQTPYLRTVAAGDANIDIATTLQNEDVTVYITWDNPPRRQIYLAKSNDTGLTWNTPFAIGNPLNSFYTPKRGQIEAFGTQAMIIWRQTEESGADETQQTCTTQYLWTTDSGVLWQEPEILFDENYGCPEESHLFGSEDGFLLFATINEQGYLLFWDGTEWSPPQPQDDFYNLTDPETNLYLKLHSLNTHLVNETLYVIGSDSFNTSDIWATGRKIEETQSWFPQPLAWTKPEELVQEYGKIGSTYLIADSIGRIHAFWNQVTTDDSNQETEIYYSVWDGINWSPAVRIIRSPSGRAYLHSVSISSEDVIYLGWESGNSEGLSVSWSDANTAYNPGDWVISDALPTPQQYATSPDICINENDDVFITYVLPLNEDRGVYLLQSSDGGSTWDQNTQIVDAVPNGWAMVDNPRISSCNQKMEILWTTYSLPPEILPLGLYASSSNDYGITWSATEEIIESNVDWDDVLQTADKNIHRIWETNERGIFFLWHQHSIYQGKSWSSPENILTTNDAIVAVSALIDPAKQLHIFFATTNISDLSMIHHWTWKGENWEVNESLNFGKATSVIDKSLSTTITSEGILGLVFGTSRIDTASDNMIYHIDFSSRKIAIPEFTQSEMAPTPKAELTKTLEPEMPTSTPQVVMSPTATPQLSDESGIIPQTNTWSGLIAGGLIGFLILVLIFTVGLFIRFRKDR